MFVPSCQYRFDIVYEVMIVCWDRISDVYNCNEDKQQLYLYSVSPLVQGMSRCSETWHCYVKSQISTRLERQHYCLLVFVVELGLNLVFKC